MTLVSCHIDGWSWCYLQSELRDSRAAGAVEGPVGEGHAGSAVRIIQEVNEWVVENAQDTAPENAQDTLIAASVVTRVTPSPTRASSTIPIISMRASGRRRQALPSHHVIIVWRMCSVVWRD